MSTELEKIKAEFEQFKNTVSEEKVKLENDLKNAQSQIEQEKDSRGKVESELLETKKKLAAGPMPVGNSQPTPKPKKILSFGIEV